ncbi:MAG: zinc-binding dehydrogenase, partial [Actinophytocola sp.]|nr:zinc-binding dehydrogenase [Actinophytocola sp.]
ASIALDYTRPDWADEVRAALGGRAVTVVLDGVGGEHGRTALELLEPGGRLLLFGWSAGEPVRLDAWDVVGRGITVAPAVGPKLLNRPGGLRELEAHAIAAAADGELVPVVSASFPLAKASDAHAALESRGTVGKVVLKP